MNLSTETIIHLSLSHDEYKLITRALTGMLSDKQEAEAVALANVMAEANVRNLEAKTEVASGTRDRIRDLQK